MIRTTLLLALLTVTDPVNGPVGAGDLVAPTAAVYRNLSAFDLKEIIVLDADTIQLELQMASFNNPYGLPLGFSHPIVDIYLGGREPGRSDLLPGHGMRLPEEEQWHVAFRLNGDSARGYEVQAEGELREFSPAVELIGDRLLVSTGIPAIENPRIAALVGLYDPFQESGWRPLASHPSAWSFSSSEQVFPVLDVLALDEDAQRNAMLTGVLPVTEASTPPVSKALWLLFMAAGLTIAGGGLLLRTRIGPDVQAGPLESEEAASHPEPAPELPDGEPAGSPEPVVVEVTEELPEPEMNAGDASRSNAPEEAVPTSDSESREDATASAADEVPIVRINYFRGASAAGRNPAGQDVEVTADSPQPDAAADAAPERNQHSESDSFEVDFSEVESATSRTEIKIPAVQPDPEQE